MITSAGLVIIHNKKILLVHPTNASWYGSYSIPKGEVDVDENIIDAMLRETKEEIGIEFKKEDLYYPVPIGVNYISNSKHIYKQVWYNVVYLREPLDLSKIKLQLDEVDWVGFLDKEEAEKRISPRLKEVLNQLDILNYEIH